MSAGKLRDVDFTFKKYTYMLISRQKVMAKVLFHLTHWRLNEIAHDPPLIPWRFLEYFRASESTEINRMRNNHRHKIRFQDIIYLKLNKWRAKIFKKTITRNYTIIFFTARQSVPQKLRKLNMQKWVNCWFRRTKTKPNTTEFHSCTING